MTEITLTTATRLLEAAVQTATTAGIPSTVTIMDAGGRIVAVNRMDGAPLVSIDTSAAKARTAVFFKSPTGDLAGAVQPGAPLYSIGDATGEQLAFLAGGVPVFSGSVLIGAIGSGGGTPDQDAEIATAAVAAVTI